jgi:hypothetical protein
MFRLLLHVNRKKLRLHLIGLGLWVCLALTGCSLLAPDLATPVNVRIPLVPTPTAQPQPPTPASAYVPLALPGDGRDELPVMSGICFESAYDAAGQVFLLRTAEDHIRFYDAADNAKLCRQPVTRYPFDFTSGRILAGGWSRGNGCTARHEVRDYQRDDAAKTLTLTLQFIAEGDCPYELVRSFWVSFPVAADYAVNIVVN